MLLTKLIEKVAGFVALTVVLIDKFKRHTMYRRINYGVSYNCTWRETSTGEELYRFACQNDRYPTGTGFLKIGICRHPEVFFYVMSHHLTLEKYPIVVATSKPWSSMEDIKLEFISDTLNVHDILTLIAPAPIDDPVLAKIGHRMPGVIARNFS